MWTVGISGKRSPRRVRLPQLPAPPEALAGGIHLGAVRIDEERHFHARSGESGRQPVDLGDVVDVSLGLRDFSLRRARVNVDVRRQIGRAHV